ISKKRIYASIDAARTNDMKLLKESYFSLKYKLGRIPTIGEFREYGSIDITKIFEKCGSYHNFLKKYEEDYQVHLTKEQETVLEYFSKKLLAYKRVQELALLQHLLERKDRLLRYGEFLKKYQVRLTEQMEESVVRNLRNEFPKEEERKRYSVCVLIEPDKNGGYRLTKSFQQMLSD